MSKGPRIPDENADIKAHVRGRIVRDVTFVLAFRVVLFVPALMYGYYTPPVNVFGVIVVEALCLLPLLLRRVWRWFTSERALEGEIIYVSHRRGTRLAGRSRSGRVLKRYNTPNYLKNPSSGTDVRFAPVDVQRVRVKTEGGKIRRLKYVCPERERVPQYSVGDRVRKYYGCKYMQKLPAKDDIFPDEREIPNICVVCGAVNEYDDEICDFCGLSLPDRTK